MPDLLFDSSPVGYAESVGPSRAHEAATVLPWWGYPSEPAVAGHERETFAVALPLMVLRGPSLHGYWVTSAATTSLQVTAVVAYGIFRDPQTGESLVHKLDDLAEWTALSGDRLAALFGASRRSLYNWRRGTSVGVEFAQRILAMHSVLAPLVRQVGATRTQGWLRGQPDRLELLEQEQWAEFEEEARRELSPYVLQATELSDDFGGSLPAYSDSVMHAWHASFLGTAVPTLPARRPDWRPRELTDAEPADEEE